MEDSVRFSSEEVGVSFSLTQEVAPGPLGHGQARGEGGGHCSPARWGKMEEEEGGWPGGSFQGKPWKLTNLRKHLTELLD